MEKKYLAFLMMLTALPILAFSQKAYDAIYYTGKTQNIVIQFTYASGYTEGSEIKTTDMKTKKKSRFLPDFDYVSDTTKMKFYHISNKGKKFDDFFLINGIYSIEDSIPETFSGTYTFKGNNYKFILKRMKTGH